MPPSLTIGDFARATHLSVKALRYYQKAGVLEPAEVDPQTGYRRYLTEQIPIAQVIRRFRSMDMPLDEIRAMLAAPNLRSRSEILARHLQNIEEDLARLQDAATSLRELLEPPVHSRPVEHRSVPSISAIAISEIIDLKDALIWFQGALGELHGLLSSQKIAASGPPGGIYSDDLFSFERGQATLFIPCEKKLRLLGRVSIFEVPAVELAVTVHEGSHAGIDLAYGLLATHVTQNALAIDGPIREYYLVSPLDTMDEKAWRTEIGWPIFRTV